MPLKDTLLSADKIKDVIRDCAGLIQSEVESKKGLSGAAVKAVFKVVQAVKPGVVEDLLSALLPEFAAAVEPFVQEWKQKGGSLAEHLKSRGDAVVQALLSITDGKAERAENKVLRSSYQKLRGAAEKHVAAAVPAIAALLEKHLKGANV